MSVLDPTTSSAALDALTSQIAVLDGAGRIVLVNESWRQFGVMSGTRSPLDEWVGVDYLRICRSSVGPDGEEGPVAAAGIAAVLAGTRREYRLEYPCDTPTRRRWFQLQVSPTAGDVPGVVVSHHDVTERKEAELERNRLLAVEQVARQRATFLAQAMEVLERSLQVDVVCSGLAQLCCSTLADVAAVDLLDERRRVTRNAVAVADPSDEGLADELRRVSTPGALLTHPVREALRNRAPVSGGIDSGLLEDGFEPEHAAVVYGLGVRSYLTVPLHGRTGVIGTLTVASRAAHHYGSGSDREALEDLARCASLALDNARLHSELESTARTLQDGLRPAALPEIPGVELAASFRPQSQTLLVGGDFYDVLALGHSSWGMTIGDVCGKGAQAATITGLTRHTARAAAVFGATPGGVLRALDDALIGETGAESEHYCTAVHAQLRTHEDGASVLLAGAGHVPPVVVRAGGAAEVVDCGGSLLGVLDAPVIGETGVELSPGDALILYTDGVLDAQAPLRQLYATDVAATLSEHAGRGAAALVAAVEALALDPPGMRQRDDIAVLAISIPE